RDNAHFQDAVLFIRNLFSEAFKDNPNLALGFLTGILRIAKESIFSGMNNLDENSIFDTRYSTYFGFTKEECRRILNDLGYADKYEDLERWYDGYRFGGEDIFNPWSVLSFLQKQGSVGAYWENTGENAILGELLFDANEETKEGLVNLFMGKKVYALVDTAITYPDIHDNPDAIYSFLMTCGYLKVDSGPITEGSNDYYLSIPNREIQSIFAREVLNRMGGGASTASHIRHAIINGDITSFVSSLAAYIKASISIKDAQYESFYHGLVLGLLSCLDNVYDPLSNRESGEGYYDIVLSPRARKYPGIILEFKAKTAKESRSLTALKDEAMKQMDANHYEEELHRVGVERILKIGIAFDRKDVLADYKEENGQN
ncbi:MAG: AAA family ATPase, partial [Bacilli bacterium]|nr:AAA family ATPase [Bacilli bacterium]